MATKSDLRLRALRTIGWISEGEDPSAYAADTADAVIDEAHAFLEGEGVAYWSLDDIPDGAMFGLVDYVAGRLARRLHGASDAAQYSGLVEIGMKNLVRFIAYKGPNAPVQAEYF